MWRYIFALIIVINLILAVFIVFFQRREPKTVWAWLLVLYFLPVVGFVLYLFAGSFFDDAGRVTLRYYYQVFLATPQYLIRFWKSIAMSLPSSAFNS